MNVFHIPEWIMFDFVSACAQTLCHGQIFFSWECVFNCRDYLQGHRKYTRIGWIIPWLYHSSCERKAITEDDNQMRGIWTLIYVCTCCIYLSATGFNGTWLCLWTDGENQYSVVRTTRKDFCTVSNFFVILGWVFTSFLKLIVSLECLINWILETGDPGKTPTPYKHTERTIRYYLNAVRPVCSPLYHCCVCIQNEEENKGVRWDSIDFVSAATVTGYWWFLVIISLGFLYCQNVGYAT